MINQAISICLFLSLTANAVDTVLFDMPMADLFRTDFQAKGGFGSYTETGAVVMTPFADRCGYMGKQLKLSESVTSRGPDVVFTADEDCWTRDTAGSLRIKIKDCWNTGQYFYISVNDAESDPARYRTRPLRGACVHSNEAGRVEYNCAGDEGQKCGLGVFGSDTVAGSKTVNCEISSGIISDSCASWRGLVSDLCRGDDQDISWSGTHLKLVELANATPEQPACLPFNTECPLAGPSAAAPAHAPIPGPVVRLTPRAGAFSTVYGQDYVASNCFDQVQLDQWNNVAMCHSDSAGTSDPWIQFDMGEVVTVDHIKIKNRNGGCSSRLGCGSTCGDTATCAGWELTVGDVACANGDDADACDQNPVCHHSGAVDTTGVYDLTASCGKTGRFVTLRLPGASRVINLLEIAVFGTAEPVARLTPIAGAMNTLYGQDYVASNCFDSTRLNKWGSQAAMCHSNSQGSSDVWLQFDMGKVVTVDHLVIENRPDACSSRLGCVEADHCAKSSVCPGFEVRVGNTACANGDDADACDHDQICAASAADTTGQNTLNVDCQSAGRFVTLRLPGADRVLNLLEMAVYGKSAPTIDAGAAAGGSSCGSCGAAPAADPSVPVSQYRPVAGALSSLYGGADWAASMCFDMVTLNQWGAPSWCVTGNKGTEANTWVQFDMGESIIVDHLVIKNRGYRANQSTGGNDACSSRLGCTGACGSTACTEGFEVLVGDTACAEGSEAPCNTDNLCYASGPTNTNGAYDLTVDCAHKHAGRYVTLRLPGVGRSLNLQEVAIFGAPNRPPLKRLTPQAGALSALYGNWNWAASMCFDDVTLNQWGAPSWCVTGNTGHEANTWVQFDMGHEVTVDHLELKNRGFFSQNDQCSSRLGCANTSSDCSNNASCPGFEVRVGNTACTEGSQEACNADPVCHTSGAIDTTGVYSLAVDCTGPGTTGRYVTLRLPGPGRVLNLQEIAVFGYDDASSCPTTGFSSIGNGFCSADGVETNMYFKRETDNAASMTTQELIDACAADAMGVEEVQAFGVSLAGEDLGTCYLYPNYDPGFSSGHYCTKVGSWAPGVGTVSQKLTNCPPDSVSGGLHSNYSWQFKKVAGSTAGAVTTTGGPDGLWSLKCYTFDSPRISVLTSMKLAGAAGRRLQGAGSGNGASDYDRLMQVAQKATCALTKTLGTDCASAKLAEAHVVGDELTMKHHLAAATEADAQALAAKLDEPTFMQSLAKNVETATGEAVAVQKANAAVTFSLPTPAPTVAAATPNPTPAPKTDRAPKKAATASPTAQPEMAVGLEEGANVGNAIVVMVLVFLVICLGGCLVIGRNRMTEVSAKQADRNNNNGQEIL